ncbi:hypothetical protein ACWCXH_23915 [Kitasatospora sp. NPDC001660]
MRRKYLSLLSVIPMLASSVVAASAASASAPSAALPATVVEYCATPYGQLTTVGNVGVQACISAYTSPGSAAPDATSSNPVALIRVPVQNLDKDYAHGVLIATSISINGAPWTWVRDQAGACNLTLQSEGSGTPPPGAFGSCPGDIEVHVSPGDQITGRGVVSVDGGASWVNVQTPTLAVPK